jgi:hypothetical protein
MVRALIMACVFFVFSISGCSICGAKKENETEDGKGSIISYRYIPILPMPVPKGLIGARGALVDWKGNSEALNLLENEALRATLGRKESSGLISYGIANSSAKISSGLFTLDSIRYTATPYLLPSYEVVCGSESGSRERCSGSAWTSRVAFLLVGVGARAEIDFSSKSRSFDAASILTFSAKADGVDGRINISSIGVTSASISPLLSASYNLSSENIESTLKSLEAVKLIATFSGGSNEVKITPQILAIDPGDMPMTLLLEDIYRVIGNPEVYRKRMENSGLKESLEQ